MHACLCLEAGAHIGPGLLSFQARDFRHHEITQDTRLGQANLIDTQFEPDYDVSPPSAPVYIYILVYIYIYSATS